MYQIDSHGPGCKPSFHSNENRSDAMEGLMVALASCSMVAITEILDKRRIFAQINSFPKESYPMGLPHPWAW